MVDWHLFVGDESALGAIGASLEALGADDQAMVFAVADGPEHRVALPSAADASITWLYRNDSSDPENLLVDAVSASPLLPGTFDVFVHGEAAETRAVRNHLSRERGIDLDSASISPYWRRKHTDEEWRQVKREWMRNAQVDVA